MKTAVDSWSPGVALDAVLRLAFFDSASSVELLDFLEAVVVVSDAQLDFNTAIYPRLLLEFPFEEIISWYW